MMCGTLPTFQEALQEPDRAFLLAKTRAMRDGGEAIIKAGVAARARTRQEERLRQVEAAPPFLKGRAERGDELPEVEVRGKRARVEEEGQGAVRKRERLKVVLRYVLEEMKGELVGELVQTLRPRWRGCLTE